MLRVMLFGCAQLWYEDKPIEKDLTRVPLLLFAYLLLERQRIHSRDALAGLFWGDYSQERARNCLNTALWRIRRTLTIENSPQEAYIISGSHGEIGFNEDSQYWLDVKEMDDAIHQATALPAEQMPASVAIRLEKALNLYHGDLLEGCYADWALREREYHRSMYLNGLAILMAFFSNQGNLDSSIDCGRRILIMEPLREEIHRDMMRLYMARGQRSKALAQFETCRKLLQDELGIPPMEETLACYYQISSESSSSTQGGLSKPQIPLPTDSSSTNLFQQAVQDLEETKQALAKGQENLRRLEKTIEELSRSNNI